MAQDPDLRRVETVAQFQAAIAGLLKNHGSLREIAADTEISRTTISEILKCIRMPRLSTVQLLVRQYDPDKAPNWIKAWHRVQEPSASVLPVQPPPLGPLLFRGRTTEIAELERVLLISIEDGGLPNVVIDGMAGVGKTAFALHVGQKIADWFPDGCHYLNMRGYSVAAMSRPWDDAVGQLLRMMRYTNIPDDAGERLQAYRKALAASAALVILDDTRSPDQVAPLLAGFGRSRVVVVSRRQMPSLDDAWPIRLDALSTAESMELFTAIVPAERLAGHEDDLQQLVELIGGLPLALRILSSKLVRRRQLSVRRLLERLNQYGRLSQLDDGERSLRAAFQLSYLELNDQQRRFFRVLGTLPGVDIEAERAAAAADIAAEEAERLLEGLLDYNLVIQLAADRYRLHDLVSEYAAQEAAMVATELAQTRRRAIDWALRRTASNSVGLAEDGASVYGDWFARERENLVASVHAAYAWGLHAATCALGSAINRPLFLGGHYEDVIATAVCRTNAAHGLGDELTAARAQLDAAQANIRSGRHNEAKVQCSAALAAFEAIGDLAGQGAALREMGNLAWYGSEYRVALGYYQRALPLQRTSGDRAGEATALSNIGAAFQQLGDTGQALDYYDRALQMRRDIGDSVGEAQTLNNIGLTHERNGALEAAMSALTDAMEIGAAAISPAQVCATLTNLGNVCRRMGRFEDGERHLVEAIATARALGGAVLEAEAQNCLGDLLNAAGQVDDARAVYEAALEVSRGGVDRYEEAHALEGLGNVLAAEGLPGTAQQHWRAAADLYRSLEVTKDLYRVEAMLR